MALNRGPSTHSSGASLALAILLAGTIAAGPVARAAEPRAGVEPVADGNASSAPGSPRPELRKRLEIPLLGAAAAIQIAGRLIEYHRPDVPPAGLDSGGIGLALDRRSLDRADAGAGRASDWAARAAIAYPFALGFARAPEGSRVDATLRRSLLYLEASALTGGITILLKRSVARPRPYAYLDEADRPEGADGSIQNGGAFQSFPSGHATTASCAAGFAITDHLLTRPGAGWREHAAVGFGGGFLAGATAALRVRAGQHFPSDVAAGAAIGGAGGAGIPLLHRYLLGRGDSRSPSPSKRAVLGAAGGAAAGVGAALLLVPALYDR